MNRPSARKKDEETEIGGRSGGNIFICIDGIPRRQDLGLVLEERERERVPQTSVSPRRPTNRRLAGLNIESADISIPTYPEVRPRAFLAESQNPNPSERESGRPLKNSSLNS